MKFHVLPEMMVLPKFARFPGLALRVVSETCNHSSFAKIGKGLRQEEDEGKELLSLALTPCVGLQDCPLFTEQEVLVRPSEDPVFLMNSFTDEMFILSRYFIEYLFGDQLIITVCAETKTLSSSE